MSRLVMFTDSYPYSRVDEWKLFELEAFADSFSEIHIAPLRGYVPDPDPRVPASVNILPPALGPNDLGTIREALRPGALARLARHPGLYDAGLNPTHMRLFLRNWALADKLLRTEVYRNHVAPLIREGHLYFFWGRGWADILPFLSKAQQAASLVRLHRFDLYPEAAGGYIPMHGPIVRSAGFLAPVSEDGVQSLVSRFPQRKADIACLRLGTIPQPRGPVAKDGVLKLVSCAAAAPVKRLHLIAEALAHATLPVRWTHIGPMPEDSPVRALAAKLPPQVEVDLMGSLLPPQVPLHYQANPYDLFVNVSASEGVPVSIMEAMAAGIPALATDVGGTRELVSDATGSLIPADTNPAAIWQAVARFAGQDEAVTEAMRQAAWERVRDNYDIRANARIVAKAIAALPPCGASRKPVVPA
ncbi:MAG: glycosyltransferase [Pseudomonadota bacterium]